MSTARLPQVAKDYQVFTVALVAVYIWITKFNVQIFKFCVFHFAFRINAQPSTLVALFFVNPIYNNP